jgi:hypothetical protein
MNTFRLEFERFAHKGRDTTAKRVEKTNGNQQTGSSSHRMDMWNTEEQEN